MNEITLNTEDFKMMLDLMFNMNNAIESLGIRIQSMENRLYVNCQNCKERRDEENILIDNYE